MRRTNMRFMQDRSLRPAAWACLLVAAWLIVAPAPASSSGERPYHAARDAAPARAATVAADAVQPPQNVTPPDFEGYLVVGRR